jgi:hypothetical protein
MPRCGATFDENSVPPWTRGNFKGGFIGCNRQPSLDSHLMHVDHTIFRGATHATGRYQQG